jgi:hypothetical protein
MAINPNTNFTAGAILTAAQQNRFPRGIMQIGKATTNFGAVSAEIVTLSAISFTAVANRYYKITYFEPEMFQNANETVTQRIRLNNVTGTLLNSSLLSRETNNNSTMQTIAVETFSAGTVTVVGTTQISGGSIFPNRSATKYAFLIVEDIGPA